MHNVYFVLVTPWLKQLDPQLPLLGSRVYVSLHVGFVVDETESGEALLGVSPTFPCHKFHSIISPHLSHSFRFVSFHYINPCGGATDMIGRHPCNSLILNIWASIIASYPSTRCCVGHKVRRYNLWSIYIIMHRSFPARSLSCTWFVQVLIL